MLLRLDRSSCPGCDGRPIVEADACAHLRAHEARLAELAASRDQGGEAAGAVAILVRVVGLHAALRWRGECFCWAEKPGMRGAWGERVRTAEKT
jgi:hypothetical protein